MFAVLWEHAVPIVNRVFLEDLSLYHVFCRLALPLFAISPAAAARLQWKCDASRCVNTRVYYHTCQLSWTECVQPCVIKHCGHMPEYTHISQAIFQGNWLPLWCFFSPTVLNYCIISRQTNTSCPTKSSADKIHLLRGTCATVVISIRFFYWFMWNQFHFADSSSDIPDTSVNNQGACFYLLGMHQSCNRIREYIQLINILPGNRWCNYLSVGGILLRECATASYICILCRRHSLLATGRFRV